ncbi:hypothetical protein [Candidatus Sororendozoicomonas aggregata]|uniref:hypothetical protein n=1 Tax=Candidatus Sororendozoicomonas aggregata TaxID=3073239 RepID=UPI002ED40CAF
MTRHKIFALVALMAGISAILAALFLWSPREKKEVMVKPDVMIEKKTMAENVPAENVPAENTSADGDNLLGDNVTRIVIEHGSDGADNINDILSDKVIVNDEVKDIHSLSEPDDKRQQ